MLKQPRPLVPFTFPFAGQSYKQRILNMQKASLIALWDLGDTSGTTAVNAEGTSARSGTYTNGVTLNAVAFTDGTAAPSFDAVDDYVNIFSSSLQSAFNNAELTVLLWAKTNAWADSTSRFTFNIGADTNNRVRILKNTTANQLSFTYTGGGTIKTVNDTSLAGSTAWFSAAITVSKSADQMKAYVNGAQVGSTQTGLGTWSGSLSSTLTTLGASAATPTQLWSGLLKYVTLWAAPLSASEVAALGTV